MAILLLGKGLSGNPVGSSLRSLIR